VCKTFVAPVRQIIGWIAKCKARFFGYSPPLLGQINIEVLVVIAVPIMVEVLPMTGLVRLLLLLVLALVFADIASRVTPILWGRWVAAILAVIATLVVGQGRVTEQFYVDAVLRDYLTQRDLAAKYAVHDESLKKIAAQYDRLRDAQSLFGSIQGKIDESQSAEINKQNVEDIKNALNNIESLATPFGAGIRIKLGPNLYRVIYPVPMRITPNITFTGLPSGVTANFNESTNIGFTVIFFPLSIPVDHFGLTASAEP
jgi:hypothetical protein